MFAAACPSCGAPVPVSLATPDAIACSNCGYHGPPDPEIRAQMQAALQVLWQMDANDRQLSAAQRLNVQSTQSYMTALIVVFLVLMTPVMLFSGSCLALVLPDGELDSVSLFLVGVGLFPLIVGLGTAALTLRYVHRRGQSITERCAALPPAGEGQPVRCHVCGGPLLARGKNAIVRCNFCQADNVVSPGVLTRVAAKRAVRVGRLVEQVHGESRALDRSVVAAGALAVVTIILSPLLGIALLFFLVLVASLIELAPISGAEYAWVSVTDTECVGRVVHERGGDVVKFENEILGVPKRVTPPPSLRRFASKEVVGHELAAEGSKRGRVERVYRSALEPSIDVVDVDVGGEKKNMRLAGACQVSSRRRIVATDAHWARAKCLRAGSGKLWVAADSAIYGMPEAGGTSNVAVEAAGVVTDFRPDGDAFLILRAVAVTDRGSVLERYAGGKAELLADGVLTFAPDGGDLVIGKSSGLYRRKADGTLETIDTSVAASLVAVSSDAVYWASPDGTVLELTKSSGSVRRIGQLTKASGLVRVGQYLYVSRPPYPIAIFPLAGGARIDVPVTQLGESNVQSDGKAVFFPLAESARGGILSLVPGTKDTTGARHYGIDGAEPTAFSIDGTELFWVDGTSIVAEPIAP